MTEPFPKFTYHPDPKGTGMVEVSDKSCACCGFARGFIYLGPVYGFNDLHEQLCPWCIADGSAAAKLDASFADTHSLQRTGVAASIIEEINLRTPSYTSWQSESWLSHCNDACEFHGDASVSDVLNASIFTKEQWLVEYQQDENGWLWVTDRYQLRRDSALYKFVCRHCEAVLFAWDLS